MILFEDSAVIMHLTRICPKSNLFFFGESFLLFASKSFPVIKSLALWWKHYQRSINFDGVDIHPLDINLIWVEGGKCYSPLPAPQSEPLKYTPRLGLKAPLGKNCSVKLRVVNNHKQTFFHHKDKNNHKTSIFSRFFVKTYQNHILPFPSQNRKITAKPAFLHLIIMSPCVK